MGWVMTKEPTRSSPFLQMAAAGQEEAQGRGRGLEGFGPMSSSSLERRGRSRGVMVNRVAEGWTWTVAAASSSQRLGTNKLRKLEDEALWCAERMLWGLQISTASTDTCCIQWHPSCCRDVL